MNRPNRQMAIANESRQIEESTARAVAAREAEPRPRTALEAMAARLKVSPKNLQNTLQSTVFSGCRTTEEFVALVLVANEYQLNPLLKEIYAFPAKGGGIVPMVGVDGWMKLMNSHPQFDGIEFEDQFDAKGNFFAIEAIIHRKDRSFPTKIIEYLDECRRGTEPWKQMPKRMLRNRVICQAARLAFGFTGIAVEGDEVTIDGGELTPTPSLPPRQSLAEELDDEIPTFDKDTGEVIEDAHVDPSTGMTVLSEDDEREMSAGEDAGGGQEFGGKFDVERDDKPAWWAKVESIRAGVAAAKNRQNLKDFDDEFTRMRAGLPDEVIAELDATIADRRRALSRQQES